MEHASRLGYVWSRILAAVFDVPIVLGWAAFAGLAGIVVRRAGFDIESLGGWDLFAFLALVFPVVVTFAALEASPRQATPGKRRFGLGVVGSRGARIGIGRSLLRSATKFAPWQLAHTAVFRLAAGDTGAAWAIMAIGAQLVVVASAILMTLDREHRSLHDLAARTVVAGAPASSPGS